MKILGISDGHECHACVMINGQIVSAIAEERLSRLKADQGFPSKSIKKVLEMSGLTPDDIDHVAFASEKYTPFHALYKISALFSVKDWVEQCEKYWKPRLIEGKQLSPLFDFNLFKHLRGEELYADPYYSFVKNLSKDETSINYDDFNEIRKASVSELTGIPKEKIRFYRHENCHKFYGLYSCPIQMNEANILTLEGGGDDSSATFSIYKNDEMKEIWASNSVNLGRLYRYITLLLGMKPLQHEYKVMGLAPYGNAYHGKNSLNYFNSLSYVNKHQILPKNVVKDLYYSARDALEGERFDGIAWGLQEHLQLILNEWVKNCVEETGIRNVILSGGVGQNIKANKSLIDSVDLDNFWAGPICGDGSLGLGAAYNAQHELNGSKTVKNLNGIYLGSEYSTKSISEAVQEFSFADNIEVITGKSEDKLASMISQGKICARFSGKMEFGQRALGNRSILANPSQYDTIEKINQQVKFRDFWMPFTPSMTEDFAKKALNNPKGLTSPYMTIAFDLTEGLEHELPAVVHPADKTVRPQMLIEKDNPSYHRLLVKIGKLTGFECVLNTSFNLHGEAIVETPKQAVETFLKCKLDGLFFDELCIVRK